ncbi:MAG: ABC transporter permease [Thermoplasmataceae archaeon]|jgi:peptide/nickel transport system permease protein|nr:ABC transporter permease [Candidatus Thermoplasmatota archaeon]
MELRFFIIRRLLLMIPTLIGLTIIVFVLMWSLPHTFLASAFINPKAPNRAQAILTAENQLGLNQGIVLAYLHYLANTLTGNWGYMTLTTPIKFDGTVLSGIGLFFPNTIQLVIFAAILSILIAIPLGTYIGARPNSIADHSGRIFSLSFYAIPVFVLAVVFQVVFGKGVIKGNPVGIFPISGTFSISAINVISPPSWLVSGVGGVVLSEPTHLIIFDSLIHGDYALAANAFMHIVLPVLVLTLSLLAGILRFLRASMVDAANSEYIKTARSKGVPENIVIKLHMRRNALIPTITVLGLLFASLLGGVVLIEDVFDYPGIGYLALSTILSGSIFGVLGTTFLFGIILITANLLVDITYAILDPRIRY